MGYSRPTFHAYTKGLLNARKGACDVRLEPSLTTVHKGSLAFLYSIDDLEKFKKNILVCVSLIYTHIPAPQSLFTLGFLR